MTGHGSTAVVHVALRIAPRWGLRSSAGAGTLALAFTTSASLLWTPASAQATAPTQDRADSARSNDEQGPQQIPEVVVTASEDLDGKRLERTPLDHGGGRDVIGPREIAESGVISVQEVMRRTPGAFVSDESGSDSLANIGLRGVTSAEGVSRSTNVALLVDGIPISPAPYGQPGTALFPFTLERLHAIDIQRGGSSVRYGPNNVAGVVNFLTRPIPDGTMYEFGGRYDSFDNSSIYNALGGTYGDFGILFEQVYKSGDTFRQNGDYAIENFALKTAYRIRDDLRVLLQMESYADDSRLSDGLNLAQYQANPDQSTSLQNRFTGEQDRVSAKLEWDISDSLRAEVITYRYDSERTFFLGSPNFYGAVATFVQATPRPMDVWAIQPQVVKRFEFGEWVADLIGGVRYTEEDIVRRTERFFPNGTQTVTGDTEFEYRAASAFVESKFQSERWAITPGVRVEQIDIDALNRIGGAAPVEQDFSEVLPALSAAYFITDDWSVYGNAQASFKPPEASQIELSTNPQDISAQYAWVYEVGTRAQMYDKHLAWDLTLYQIEYQDLLERDPAQFDVFVNAGRARHRGVELALDADLSQIAFEGFGAWASIAYNDSEYRSGQFAGNQVIAAMPWLASWGLRYTHAYSGLWAGLDGFYVDDAFTDRANTVPINAAANQGERPDYTVWNTRVGLRRKLSKSIELRCEVALRNLFDEKYFDIRPGGRGIFPGAPFSVGGQFGLNFSF